MPGGNCVTSGFRPTGYDIAAYAGHENWNGERWAWEFLRRNSRFQMWCYEAETGGLSTAKKNQLALQKFGLLSYKFFAEDFTAGKPPRFAIKKIRSWLRSTPQQIKKRPSKKVSITLRMGEVLVKFDVKGTIRASIWCRASYGHQCANQFSRYCALICRPTRVGATSKCGCLHAQNVAHAVQCSAV